MVFIFVRLRAHLVRVVFNVRVVCRTWLVLLVRFRILLIEVEIGVQFHFDGRWRPWTRDDLDRWTPSVAMILFVIMLAFSVALLGLQKSGNLFMLRPREAECLHTWCENRASPTAPRM